MPGQEDIFKALLIQAGAVGAFVLAGVASLFAPLKIDLALGAFGLVYSYIAFKYFTHYGAPSLKMYGLIFIPSAALLGVTVFQIPRLLKAASEY